MGTTAKDRFITILRSQYEHAFANDPSYAMAAARTTSGQMAIMITEGLLTGQADKDGKCVKAACAALGVKHTYKAIRVFLETGAKA